MTNLQHKHPADIAEHLAELNNKDRNLSFMLLSGQMKADVFPYFDSTIQQEKIKLGKMEKI